MKTYNKSIYNFLKLHFVIFATEGRVANREGSLIGTFPLRVRMCVQCCLYICVCVCVCLYVCVSVCARAVGMCVYLCMRVCVSLFLCGDAPAGGPQMAGSRFSLTRAVTSCAGFWVTGRLPAAAGSQGSQGSTESELPAQQLSSDSAVAITHTYRQQAADN